MSLASVEDVQKALGRAPTAEETARLPGLLDEASDLVIGHLGCEPEPPVPDAVNRATARIVARVLMQDSTAGSGSTIGVTQISGTAGPFTRQMTLADGSGSSSPWLERTDKLKLRPYRCGGGMQSVSLSSEQSGR